MGEKMMKITIMGGILIVTAVIALLLILDVSIEKRSAIVTEKIYLE
jgi:hypothetical protein